MLFLGRFLGELSKKANLPEITGEIIGGIILGPSILGKINFDLYQTLFSASSPASYILESLFQLSLILVMFISGLKIDLHSVIKQKKAAFLITIFGTFIPFIVGMLVALSLPKFFLAPVSNHSNFIFPFFLGTAFAVEALPVVAKILMDTQIIHTSIGVIIISSAILTDIIGWGFFAFITQSQARPSVFTIFFISLFFISLRTLGDRLMRKFLQKIEHTCHWPSIVLSLCLCICLFFTILSASLSLHPCLGAFLSGTILGNIVKNYNQVKEILDQFIMSFFSPLFFVSISLKVNFIEHFNFALVISILVLASLSKIIAVHIGAYFSGIKKEEALIISVALNARGAMGIVFSTIALDLGIISNPIHVALVIMGLTTSIISGVVIKKYYTTIFLKN